METTDNRQSNAPANEKKPRKQKLNQAIFIRYEVSRPDGHIETVMDSYRNRLGRIYEHYNMETGKFEFTFKNYAGETLFKSDDHIRLREQILSHKQEMMREAHERRIEQKKQKEIPVAEKYRSQKNQKKTILPPAGEVESFVEKTVKESRDVLQTVQDFAGGEEELRAEEMRQIRRAKERGRDREVSR